MATLTRPKQLARPSSSPLLTSGIPSPFPREQYAQLQRQSADDVFTQQVDDQSGPSRVVDSENTREYKSQSVLEEVMPSIVHVQKSCLTTLNNLLSVPIGWSPIIPDRRHSMPSGSQTSSTSYTDAESSSSALQTLVTNLRNREGTENMIQIASAQDDAELLNEIRTRVNAISSILEPADVLLANLLVSLLSHLQKLSTIQSNSTKSLSEANFPSPRDVAGPSDPFSLLRRHLSDLQIERLSSQPDILPPDAPPVRVVEAALLWNKIDEELESVMTMCKERAENLLHQPPDTISLPPEYDIEDDYDYKSDILPEYDEAAVRTSIDSKSRHTLHSPTSSRQMDEKMRLDLEGVTMAIDRLYLVAPQLHNQRVELKSTKLAQLEKARKEGMQTPRARNQKENDMQELERMLDLLGKASERVLTDQSVILDGGLPLRLEKTRQKELAEKQAFVEQLAKHSSAGRLHNQDAVMQPRTKDPHALLTLPEFIREAVPASVIRADPKALLTLPEFVKESPPAHLVNNDSEISSHEYKSLRHRSLSAPPLSWLRSSSSKSSSSSNSGASHSRLSSNQSGVDMKSPVGIEVHYVAENHENLQHVLVFFTVTGATPGVDIEAEVLPPFPENNSEGGDRLIIRSGSRNSLPLLLPARILPGKQEVRVQSTHYEIKLTTVGPRPSADSPVEDPPPLLDAAQLSIAKPSSFTCASCPLILVQTTKISEYRDLPSEHWQELVEAWMCHSDQKLHDQVMKHGKTGFWPEAEQALVGGSYILFEESSVAQHNLHLAKEAKKTGAGVSQRSSRLVVSEALDAGTCVSSKPTVVLGRCNTVLRWWMSVKAATISVDTKRPRITDVAFWPRSLARSNNSRVYEAHIMGATIETTFITFLIHVMRDFVLTVTFLQAGEDWCLVRCLCGAVLGRYQGHPTGDGSRNVFRLLKFAIRPVSLNIEPLRIPLSAFLVEDMTEFVRAHATYRFVILDEEGELPRILIWLFKPSIRLAYTAPTPYAIPKSGSIHAAKVLFKILTPSERTSDIKPESNNAYPETMRMMTGLEVGWLHRA
ncbi:hypothetical protein C0995_008234 [Termitomyces sp. Mi166|nr:hypothetical protein C0995_008234 [Termitomyces sp. Mi166\